MKRNSDETETNIVEQIATIFAIKAALFYYVRIQGSRQQQPTAAAAAAAGGSGGEISWPFEGVPEG